MLCIRPCWLLDSRVISFVDSVNLQEASLTLKQHLMSPNGDARNCLKKLKIHIRKWYHEDINNILFQHFLFNLLTVVGTVTNDRSMEYIFPVSTGLYEVVIYAQTGYDVSVIMKKIFENEGSQYNISGKSSLIIQFNCTMEAGEHNDTESGECLIYVIKYIECMSQERSINEAVDIILRENSVFDFYYDH